MYHSTIGENRLPVACSFGVSDEGDVEDLQVYIFSDSRDILDALSESEGARLAAECLAYYLAEAKQSNDEQAISNHIAKQEMTC